MKDERLQHITARIAAASLRNDWEFIEDVLRDEFQRERTAAVDNYKEHLRTMERMARRYDLRHDVIFETADGLRQKVAIEFGGFWESRPPPILKRACRAFTAAVLPVGECIASLTSVPTRTYSLVGYDPETDLPLYRELP